MLTLENLTISVAAKTILKEIDLVLKKGEVTVLFGPNGSGKTTLIRAIMGFSGYNIAAGRILFNGKEINDFSIEKRVKLGLGIMYQHPPKIRGVKLHQIAQFLCSDEEKIQVLAEKLSLRDHLNRDVNLAFSGGEMKRSELFQVLLQDPDLLLLDEPESGVDLENISIMGRVLSEYLQKEGKSALIITHTGYILDYIKAASGCVMIDGKFWCAGQPKEIFENIKGFGYEKCKDCKWQKKS